MRAPTLLLLDGGGAHGTVGSLGVLLGVHQLVTDLTLMTSRVMKVGVLAGLLLRSLLPAVSTHHVLVLVVVVVLELVEVGLGHL